MNHEHILRAALAGSIEQKCILMVSKCGCEVAMNIIKFMLM